MTTILRFDVINVRMPFGVGDPERASRNGSADGKERVELPPELERFRLYTDAELDNLPPVTWLIDGYLATGELTVLFGKGDTYKSFFALDWAASLANARATVVYIAAEGASGLKAREEAWKRDHDVPALPNLHFMPSNVALQKGDDVRGWIEAMVLQLTPLHPDLVVVDTLARNFVGGNESDPKDMGEFVEGVERIRRTLETAVLVIHHSTKAGDTERGTESLRNASFAMYRFEKVGGAGELRAVKVRCDRMKDAEPPPLVTLRPRKINLPDLGENVSSLVAGWGSVSPAGEPAVSGVFVGVNTPDEKRLLQAVKRANGRANSRELCKQLKWSTTKTQNVLKSLVNGGFLVREGQGKATSYAVAAGGENGA